MNDEFDALVYETFYKIMEVKPDFATFLGIRQYDKKMPAATLQAQEAYIRFLKEYIKKFEALEGAITPERQVDKDLMIYILKNYLFEEDSIRMWEKDPDVTDIFSQAIFPLVAREVAPFGERLESITARLALYPAYIQEVKSRIKSSNTLWVDMAKEACGNLPVFLETIVAASREHGLDTTELDEVCSKVKDALAEHIAWLDTVPCDGEPALGKELFESLLQVRELGFTADEMLKIGETYLEKERKRIEELRSAENAEPPQEKSEDTCTFEEVMDIFREAIAHARRITVEKGFASVPKNEKLIVVETPSFMRHVLPGAAYFPPGMFEKDQTGLYFLTPGEGDTRRPDYEGVLNVSVHEGYPGHHLQLIWANKHPSLVRALCQPPEFLEGWAHYCEERMRDYGLGSTTFQIVQSGYMVFRAARIIIDVNLQCKKMTFDDAVSYFHNDIGVDKHVATIEVKRYTKNPGQPLSYLLGKYLLLQVQKDVKKHMKERYSDRQFHDALLQGGSLPFPYLREELKLKGMLP